VPIAYFPGGYIFYPPSHYTAPETSSTNPTPGQATA
jgi:hypothetical protein